MKKILVADDDGNIRTLLKHVLTREGYQVMEASDGRDAKLKLKETIADLAVVD